jgi:hypothetical protein
MPLPWWKTPWIVWNLLAIALVAGLLGFVWLRQPTDLRFVKGAHLAGFPEEPLGDVLDQFLGDPQWQATRDADGQHFVSVRGRVNYMGAATAVVLFRVDTERRSIALAGLELDGRPKPVLVQSDFLRRAYANYQKVLLRR